MADISDLRAVDVGMFAQAGNTARAKLVRIVDGDTAHFIMQLSMHDDKPIKLVCRLAGLDTPEMSKMSGPAKQARNRLVQLATSCSVDIGDMLDNKLLNMHIDIMNKKVLNLECYGGDKYGRELVRIFTDDNACINDILINEGYARAYDGGPKSAW